MTKVLIAYFIWGHSMTVIYLSRKYCYSAILYDLVKFFFWLHNPQIYILKFIYHILYSTSEIAWVQELWYWKMNSGREINTQRMSKMFISWQCQSLSPGWSFLRSSPEWVQAVLTSLRWLFGCPLVSCSAQGTGNNLLCWYYHCFTRCIPIYSQVTYIWRVKKKCELHPNLLLE